LGAGERARGGAEALRRERRGGRDAPDLKKARRRSRKEKEQNMLAAEERRNRFQEGCTAERGTRPGEKKGRAQIGEKETRWDVKRKKKERYPKGNSVDVRRGEDGTSCSERGNAKISKRKGRIRAHLKSERRGRKSETTLVAPTTKRPEPEGGKTKRRAGMLDVEEKSLCWWKLSTKKGKRKKFPAEKEDFEGKKKKEKRPRQVL